MKTKAHRNPKTRWRGVIPLKLMKELDKNPLCIFDRPPHDPASHDTIKFAFFGPSAPLSSRPWKECSLLKHHKWLADFDWAVILESARTSQERRLLEKGMQQNRISKLLKSGWAWNENGRLALARTNTRTEKQKPMEALPCLFQFSGFAWPVHDPLRTLLELKLNVVPDIDKKNAAGKTDKVFELNLAALKADAEFFRKSPVREIRERAVNVIRQCDQIVWMLDHGADAFMLAWHGIELGQASTTLRTLADSEMIHDNVKGAVMRGKRPGHLRELIDRTLRQLRTELHRSPTTKKVMDALGAVPCDPEKPGGPWRIKIAGKTYERKDVVNTLRNARKSMRKYDAQ